MLTSHSLVFKLSLHFSYFCSVAWLKELDLVIPSFPECCMNPSQQWNSTQIYLNNYPACAYRPLLGQDQNYSSYIQRTTADIVQFLPKRIHQRADAILSTDGPWTNIPLSSSSNSVSITLPVTSSKKDKDRQQRVDLSNVPFSICNLPWLICIPMKYIYIHTTMEHRIQSHTLD